MEILLDSHRLDEGQGGSPGAMKLQILEPLFQFYAARLARLGDQQRRDLRADGQEGKLDPNKVVAWMTDQSCNGDELKVLVSLVPDPARSGSAYRFDSTITAMLLALRNAGFVLDNYRLNWKSAAGRSIDLQTVEPTPGRVRISLPGGASDTFRRLPGAILLRKQKLPELPANAQVARVKHANPAPHELVLMLLVPETPVVGVDTGILQTSLDIARECERQQGRRTVRIIGPHFSGSTSSILRTLISWLRNLAPLPPGAVECDLTKVHWINGGAVSLDIDQIQCTFDSSVGKERVVLENVIYGSDDMDEALLSYLKKQASPVFGNNRIAFLTEETTGYGQLATLGHLPNNASASYASRSIEKFDAYRFTFPLYISEIRRRYARQGSSGGQSSLTLRTAERLRFDEDEGTDKPEFVRPESPAFNSASDELRLLRVAEQINRHGIRIVWLSATDLRDRLFLAEFLRIHCPDVQIISPVADPPFTHNQRISRLRGLLFASTHPMWDEGEKRHFLTLPEHPAFGTYNATIAHLCELRACAKITFTIFGSVTSLYAARWCSSNLRETRAVPDTAPPVPYRSP